jgi:hypothetical protein
MKTKILLFSLFSLFLFAGFAQRSGDVTIYSNTGKKFFVVLNGIRQNTEPETNVNISGLTAEWYKCLIIAEDKSFTIEKTIGVKMDSVVTYQITGKKKKYKLRYYTEAARGGVAPTEQVNVVYHPTDLPTNGGTSGTTSQPNGQINSGGGGTNTGSMNGSTTINTGTTTTTTTTQTNGTNGTGQVGGISIGINASENGGTITMGGQMGTESVNINVNINGTGLGTTTNTNGGTVTSTYEETVTTNTTSTTINGVTTTSEETIITTNANGNGSTSTTNGGTVYTDYNTEYVDPTTNLIYTDGNCLASDLDLEAYKVAIQNESFSEGQMNIADQIALNKCLTVDQIAEITELFTFSENKLAFLEAAYINCINQADYRQLLALLTFSEDKAALEQFINSH